MSDERKWWPAEWADEAMPPGRASPNDFIINAEGHYFLGYALDAEDVDEFQKRFFSTRIDPDDVIEFICCDDLGDVDVRIQPEGFSIIGDVAEDATHFWQPGSNEMLAGSIKQFVEIYRENYPIDSDPITLKMARWSDSIAHRFELSFEGQKITPAFVLLQPHAMNQ